MNPEAKFAKACREIAASYGCRFGKYVRVGDTGGFDNMLDVPKDRYRYSHHDTIGVSVRVELKTEAGTLSAKQERELRYLVSAGLPHAVVASEVSMHMACREVVRKPFWPPTPDHLKELLDVDA